MPVYNEEGTLAEVVKRVRAVKFPISTELIIVDDGSIDSTSRILKKFSKYKDVRIISYFENKGKGFAVRTGLDNAKGSIMCIQDADLEYNPEDLLSMLKLVLQGKEVVYGSRFLGKKYKFKGENRLILPSHLLGNKFLSFMTTVMFGSKITDMETCYKMFRKEVLKDVELKAKGFELEPELTAKILKRHYKIIEVPISHNPRSFDEGKKITKWDGLKALMYLWKYRFRE